MKIAIVGARGQLGQDLCRALSGSVVTLDRPDMDLKRPETLAAALDAHRPNMVVNCAAYNFVDRGEDEPSETFAVNALGARDLALACRELDCVLVHLSSDFVFGLDAERRTPYTELDAPGPLSVYGISKLAGEHFVRAICPRHFVIRTCGLYGRRGQGGKGGNFVEAMLKRAAAGVPWNVVDDQQCTPTATADLAPAIAALIGTDAYGLYHLTNAGSCTWFQFAQAILADAGLGDRAQPTTSVAYGAKARRPGYSVLDCSKYSRLGLPLMRDWRDALRDYLGLAKP